MPEFFVEGGFMMWPVLAFGLLTLWGSGTYAAAPQRTRLGLPLSLAATTTVAGAHGTWLDVAAVFRFLEDRTRASDADFARILVTGLKESTRPLALAGLFVTLGLLGVAIGMWRQGRAEAQ